MELIRFQPYGTSRVGSLWASRIPSSLSATIWSSVQDWKHQRDTRKCNGDCRWITSTKLIQEFPAHDIIRGGFLKDHFNLHKNGKHRWSYLRMFVELVMIFSEIIYNRENILVDLIKRWISIKMAEQFNDSWLRN